MAASVGPTVGLPGRARRTGKSGTVWENAQQQAEVIALEWNVAIQQIPVVISGSWRTETKAGGEERAGTFRYQDIHDKWTLRVWRYVRARRDGDRTSILSAAPVFNLVTKLDDIDAPDVTKWQLDDCELFEYSGGSSQDDDLIIREIPFTFREENPLNAFEYGPNGIPIVFSASA